MCEGTRSTQSDREASHYVEDFFTIVMGRVRTGIRLFEFMVEDMGEAMISLDTDRSMAMLVVDVDVSDRTHGMDACVFVLLIDEVEPPVDVDCRCRFDVDDEIVEPNDERRVFDTGGFVRVFAVGGGTRGIKR